MATKPLCLALALIGSAIVCLPIQAQSPALSPVAHPALWPGAASPAAITDRATEARIEKLLKGMTLEQKVGQTIQADISSIKPEDLDKYPIGSILAGGNSGPFGDERGSSSKWAELVREFRSHSKAAGGIPIIFGVDAVHGHSNVPGATIFPHNIALGATHDPALVRQIGAAAADEVSASGIEWTFAPTLAVPQDLRWGRSYEGFSSDPALVASYARAMTLGLQGNLISSKPIANNHVAATPKHFLADGGTHDGKDQGDAQIPESELIATHAQGYPAAIDAGALTVMVSFSSWNGVKNHGNKSLLTGVLKERMGFKGLLVGDWNAHGQVEGCTTVHCPAAYNAGLDLFMAPDSWKGLYENTIEDVRAGRIAEARIDDAVRRILRVKAKLGLLDGRPIRDVPAELGSDAHRAIARQAVAESLVLLKNNGVLPIKKGARVLVAGDGADNMAKQTGGWTITWQGSDTTKRDFPRGKTIWEGIDRAVKDAGGSAELSADGKFESKPDVAIVVFGESPYAEFQGDIATLAYQPQDTADLALLKRLKAAGIPVVSIFLSGRPLFVSAEINASDAFVAAWLPGSQADGVADVLVSGRNGRPAHDFKGRLPFAWPRDAKSPVANPLFARGYGLTYAKPGTVGQLDENPGIDLSQALNVESYFDRGRALAPWGMTLVDANGSRPVSSGEAASPLNLVRAHPVDVGAQEDSLAVDWTGPGSISLDGPQVDLGRQLTGAFGMEATLVVTRPPSGQVALTVGGQSLSATSALQKPGPVTLLVPLRCYADRGVDFGAVRTPIQISSTGALGLVVRRLRLVPIGAPTACLPAN